MVSIWYFVINSYTYPNNRSSFTYLKTNDNISAYCLLVLDDFAVFQAAFFASLMFSCTRTRSSGDTSRPHSQDPQDSKSNSGVYASSGIANRSKLKDISIIHLLISFANNLSTQKQKKCSQTCNCPHFYYITPHVEDFFYCKKIIEARLFIHVYLQYSNDTVAQAVIP